MDVSNSNNDDEYYIKDTKAKEFISAKLIDYIYEIICKVLSERNHEFMAYVDEYVENKEPIDPPITEDDEYNRLLSSINDWSYDDLFNETLENVHYDNNFQTDLIEININNINFYITRQDKEELFYEVRLQVYKRLSKFIEELNNDLDKFYY